MGKMTPFQMALLGIFGFFTMAGVFGFAIYSGQTLNQTLQPVEVWGSFDEELFHQFIYEISAEDERGDYVKYRYIPPEEFDYKLAEAIASGVGPDLFIIDQTQTIKHWFKIKHIPYENYVPKRDFLDRYIDATEVFLSRDGIIAFPISVDPLILFYNRDIFAENGIARPPRYWDEVIETVEQVTKKDEDGAIKVAGIALGTFSNIKHAKDILTTMILQKGGKITIYDDQEGKFYSGLKQKRGDEIPTVSALRLYTEFANPAKDSYSWNRALDNDIDLFAQNRLAMYIGRMSDFEAIKNKSPNLNFDIAILPQMRDDDSIVLTGGRVHAVAISAYTKDPYSAFEIAKFLSSPTAIEIFNKLRKTSSPFRGHLEVSFKEKIFEVVRRGTLMVRVWLDPNPQATYEVFANLVRAVLSGRMKYIQAVNIADQKLTDILKRLGQ